MVPDIVIVREDNGYRLLHGHLRLATELSLNEEVTVEVPGDGPVKISRTKHGYVCNTEGQFLPMHCDYRSSFHQTSDDPMHWN